ncbi:MAG: YraN family protein [Pyrinomonadaceae bacterium]
MKQPVLNLTEPATRILGRRGEELAARFLEQKGFRLVAANFTVPVGRNRRGAVVNAEIDLIAYDGETLCFIEVKTRSSDEFAAPEAAVNLRKQRQIIRAARVYRQFFGVRDKPFRYDVVGIVMPVNQKPKIQLLAGFWTEAKFRKTHWKREF